MSTNKNNIPYSASDIEKYRKGELSAGEMHDLEQAALDDPFLADAIDGLIQHPISQQDHADLQDRLNKRITDDTRRGAILLLRRRITLAAALLMLLGIGFTFFYHRPGQPQRMAQPAVTATAKAPQPIAPATAKTSEPAAPTTEFKASADKADSTPIALTQPRSARSTPTRHHLPATDESITVASAARPVPLNKKSAHIADSANLSDDLRQTSAIRLEPKDAIHNIPPLDKDSITLPSMKKAPSTAQFYNFRPTEPLVFSGKVLDINYRPLAGASLTFQGNRPSGTITDNEGFFKLSVPRTDTTLQLTVSLVGYNQASLALNGLSFQSPSSNVIYLKPSNASLDEVVVEGYGSRRKAIQATVPGSSNDRLDTSWQNAAPVIGRPAYLQYIRMTKGKLGLDSTVTGTETVSFLVARDGTLSSFKIEQSLSPAHDAAIIRLVMDGPAWRLIRGKNVRAAVTVNF